MRAQVSGQPVCLNAAGHLDRKMLEHYSHVRNAAKRKAVEAISSYRPDEPVKSPSQSSSESVQ